MNIAIAAHHGNFGRACMYEQNRSMATHAHREAHLIFHLCGQQPRFTVSGDVVTVDKNQALAVNPLQAHDVTFNENAESALLLTLYIDPIWFLEADRSSDGTFRFGSNVIDMGPDICRLVKIVAGLLVDTDHLRLIDGYLSELTQACLDQSWQWSPERSGSQRIWAGIKDHRVRKSIQLIQCGVGDDMPLDEVASEAGLSRPHFYKLFRENVGITPNVYYNILRMEAAIDRLVKTDEPVTSIGLDLGFASQASFTRFFGANVGIPPTDYRRVAHFT